jgi:Domain of unknown function (DUF5615)
MRFLADENFPGNGVAALQAAGHDIVWILANLRGEPDCRHRQGLYYFVCRCQQPPTLEIHFLQELANVLIGPDTFR